MISGAGADLTVGRAKHERVPGVTRTENLSLILRANEALASFPGVSVAVVRGRALGFGTGLALHSDLALAADTAVLGFDELAHGLPPLVVLTYLYRHVTPKVADDLVLTGRRVGAPEALTLGLVSRVVAEADLDDVVARTVAELAGRDPSALRLLKEFGRAHKNTAPHPGGRRRRRRPPRRLDRTSADRSLSGSHLMTTTSEPTPPGTTTATSPPAPASTRRQRRSAFASAWLGWGLDGFETYAIVLVSSFVVADLIGPNSSAVYVATIVAVQLVAWALGGLASGVLIDYFGRRRLLMYSIVLYTVATALSALSPNFAVFLILRVIAGFGMGAEWGPGSALVAETWPDRSRGKGLALLQSAFGFGFLAATGTFFLLQQIDGTTTWRWMLARRRGARPAVAVPAQSGARVAAVGDRRPASP